MVVPQMLDYCNRIWFRYQRLYFTAGQLVLLLAQTTHGRPASAA